MVFSSLTFLFIFLPLTMVLYYAKMDMKWRNMVLLIASLIFYAWGEPVYVVLMVISIVLNFYLGRDLYRTRSKAVLIYGVIVNLFVIGYFKYAAFLIGTINAITGLNIPQKKLALPIGISFYTFQALSYLIDVYRGKSKPQKRLVPFALYITMFPQLIAGPIVRYEDIVLKLNKRPYGKKTFQEGIRIFIIGFAKKVILANTMGAIHDEVLGMGIGNLSALTAWVGAIAYTLQIYNDFSGYSDMAIGLGKMFGFRFNKNFDCPYRSLSVTEFWRRWHISLSTWFKEYVYIPLGGNRKGRNRQILNLLVVWALTGLWHGAAWNFVLWGMYYGILLIVEKFLIGDKIEKLPVAIRWLITAVIVIIGWVFFFSDSMGSSFKYLGSMIGLEGGFADNTGVFLAFNSLIMILISLVPAVIDFDTAEDSESSAVTKGVRWAVYVLLFVISLAFLVGESYNPFLYFRF